MEYQVSLPTFEGPFALLFHLIEKAEVDIYEISIAEITAQYLETLQMMQELNLDLASEFMVMAATLLKIKSKKLLPESVGIDDEDDDELLAIESQEELVQRLLEYRYFRNVAEELRRYEQEQKRVFVRSLAGKKVVLINPNQPDFSHTGITLSGLAAAFEKVLAAYQRQPQEVAPDDFSVAEQMDYILRVLWQKKGGLEFTALFSPSAHLGEIIASFVAILELVRLRKIVVWQSQPFGDLIVMKR